MGHLSDIYSVADVAVVGGNFLGSCGHNLFEPVAMGVPVICGPNTKTGEGVYSQLVQADGVVQALPQNLLERVRDILLDSHGAHERCLRAYEVLTRLAKSAERNLRIAENLAQGREPEA